MRTRRNRVVTLVALAVLTGCGSGDEATQPPGDVGVVRAWTEAVR
jgi:predicted component of type VI protein secretion system